MIPFKTANILIPKNIDLKYWSVIACDQYTSEIEYWNKVSDIVGTNPSTLNLILPEVYLNSEDIESRIISINNNMKDMIDNDMFTEYKDSMIYIERTLSNGMVREGLLGVIDLEDYSYTDGSSLLIRATEKTVIERIPPRVKVRENALLELPHILVLVDDDKKEIIESLKDKVNNSDVIYDFDLMLNGGHIKGYKLDEDIISDIESKLEKLNNQEYFDNKYNVKNKPVLLFAVGDGNHSLASAKKCYEEHNGNRYALVEIVNLHGDALEFDAIHRIIYNTNVDEFINELNNYYDISEKGPGQKFKIVSENYNKTLYIKNPKSNIVVGSIQLFLDNYIKKYNCNIDYIHGIDTVKRLASTHGNIGIIFEPISKNDLFKTIIIDGILPRKTFSMGHSDDKRFYLEVRKIK